jgi:hypothetical protein
MRSELLRSLPGFMFSTPLPSGHSGDVLDLFANLMSLTADIRAFFSSLRWLPSAPHFSAADVPATDALRGRRQYGS